MTPQTHERITVRDWFLPDNYGGYTIFFDLTIDGNRIYRVPAPDIWKDEEIEALHELFGLAR